MSERVNAVLRRCGTTMSKAAAWSGPTARGYLSLARGVSPFLSDRRRQQLLNSLRGARWPASSLSPRRVRLGRDTSVLLHPHNEEFDLAAVLGGRLEYETEVFELLDGRMSDYETVIEIGANVGVFTLYFASKLARSTSSGTVFAFEPSRRAYARLLANLAENRAGNVVPFNCAVADRTGVALLHEPSQHLSNGSLRQEIARGHSSQVSSSPVVVLQASLLISLIPPVGRTLIKIDAEGAEAEILHSLAPLVRTSRPDLVVEALPTLEREINLAFDLRRLEYVPFSIEAGGLRRRDRITAVGGRDCLLIPSERVPAGGESSS